MSRLNGVKTAALIGGAAVVGSGTASAGDGNLILCPTSDNTFYCQFVRGFNIFKMVLFIITVFIALYIAWITYRKM